jgi:N-acetylmuramoyl-L-alanine amidase
MLKFKGTFTKRKQVTKYIFIHYAQARKADEHDIHSWHLERGWLGFGYHELIRITGEHIKGRPTWAEGAHVKSYNGESIGICLEGDFQGTNLGLLQKNKLIERLVYYRELYPEAIILGHRDVKPSNPCPGIGHKHFWEIVQTVESLLHKKRLTERDTLYKRFRRILKRRRIGG